MSALAPVTARRSRGAPKPGAATVGGVLAGGLLGVFLLMDPPNHSPPPQASGALYVPFVLTGLYFLLSEADLKENYSVFEEALSPGWQLTEWTSRVFLTLWFAIILKFPYGALPHWAIGGANGSNPDELNELEFRLLLLLCAHLGMLLWDTLILYKQDDTKEPLVSPTLILGDTFGGLLTLAAVWCLGPLGDAAPSGPAKLTIFLFSVAYVLVYHRAVKKLLDLFVEVIATYSRVVRINWPTIRIARFTSICGVFAVAIALAAAIYATGRSH